MCCLVYNSACCSVLQRVAACCSVLQQVVVCCNVLQCVAECSGGSACRVYESCLTWVVLCCSVLQYLAMWWVWCSQNVIMVYICRHICCLAYNPACCSVLHRRVVCCSFMVAECCIACQVHESCLARVAVCCRVLQYLHCVWFGFVYLHCCFYYFKQYFSILAWRSMWWGSWRIFGDKSVTIAQWRRARDLTNLDYPNVPGSIPAKNSIWISANRPSSKGSKPLFLVIKAELKSM